MLLKLKTKTRTSNNNSQLEQAPCLVSLLDKYEDRLYVDSADSVNQTVDDQSSLAEDGLSRNEKTNQKWSTELSPCLSKLLSAAQELVKTVHLVHGIQRLREELPRSATAHSLQHRRDVCFSQAVNNLSLYIYF